MSDRRICSVLLAGLAWAVLVLTPHRAAAVQKFGPLQLSGNLQSQNLVRSLDVETHQFIQNRNTARLRLDYDWLQAGKFYNRYNIPFLESSHLFVLWRGVYDSIYDTTPGFVTKTDIHSRAYGGLDVFDFARTVGNVGTGRKFTINELGLGGLSKDQRDALRFDNQLREAYVDTKFRNIHVGKEHHIFHLHSHQWLETPDDDNSSYLDSQAIGPGGANDRHDPGRMF